MAGNKIGKVMFKFLQVPFTREAAPLLAVTAAGCTYGIIHGFTRLNDPHYIRTRPRHAYKNTSSSGEH
ncbi:hypothetical protein EC988_007578 [Linderina pennispora]|nr:hypothetical protein EC988_007578 [Linderina pennispora]